MRSLLLLALAPLAVVAAEQPADASGCDTGPYTTTFDPALGCEVAVYFGPQNGSPALVVFAKRGEQLVDVTGTITSSQTTLDVHYSNWDCDGNLIIEYNAPETYDVHRVTLAGAQVGDDLIFGGDYAHVSLGRVSTGGACAEDMTRLMPFCTGRNSGYPCEDELPPPEEDIPETETTAGCSATGGGSAGIAFCLALFAVRRRRRT